MGLQISYDYSVDCSNKLALNSTYNNSLMKMLKFKEIKKFSSAINFNPESIGDYNLD